jgi:hypothetical protein
MPGGGEQPVVVLSARAAGQQVRGDSGVPAGGRRLGLAEHEVNVNVENP